MPSVYGRQWQGLEPDIERLGMARKLQQLFPDPLVLNTMYTYRHCDNLTVASTQFYSTKMLKQEPSSHISLIFNEIIEQTMVSTEILFAQ